jgi:PAS domain S-box-containing protein
MLDELIHNPNVEKYVTVYERGKYLFLEGDDSQDLYVLISGHVEILKGDKKLDEITEPGALFGELSFLLGAKRTATARAEGTVEALRIPKEEITDFLHDFPSVAGEITQFLAQRLDERSQALYGLKELCDQLPDAVIITDRDGRISTWNSAAEKLYGRDWHDLHQGKIQDVYEDPQALEAFLEEVQSKYTVKEKILKTKHPSKGSHFVSTSTTLLYDGHHNFQGVLFLGRDATALQKLERRYRRVRNWLIPSFLLLGVLAAAVFLGYPYFSRGVQSVDLQKEELRNEIARDYLLLKSLLIKPFEDRNRSETTRVMKDFFDMQLEAKTPYKGVVLLDQNKSVFDAYSPSGSTANVGSSYGGIAFQGSENSLYSVLVLYRTDEAHPMGKRGLEIAFELKREGKTLGWLLFQMDMACLNHAYCVTEEDLRRFQF